MVVYFSGTGNSRYCAELIAAQLGDELRDSAGFIKNGIQAELLSGKPWVFVAPTYAWRMPRVFEQFIRSAWLQGSREAYFVLTCGSESGNAGEYLEMLALDIGLEYKGMFSVAMPENYIAMFSAPPAERVDSMLDAAEKAIKDAAGVISRGESFAPPRVTAADRLKSGWINEMFYKHWIGAKKFRVTDKCVSCGLCAEKCPLANISLESGKPVWSDKCTHCMACICACPAEAIEYGRISVGKTRYICPRKVK